MGFLHLLFNFYNNTTHPGFGFVVALWGFKENQSVTV
jgi:hypothetical protein